MNYYADIILPLAVPMRYTYVIPLEMEGKVEVGSLCVVPLGRSKFYTGVVARVHREAPPATIQVKPLAEVVEFLPLRQEQLQLWQWMAHYYMCTEGEVMTAALPTGMKMESETRVQVSLDFEAVETLTPREREVWQQVPLDKSVSALQLQRKVKGGDVMPCLRRLLAKGAVEVAESLVRQYRPLREVMLRLPEEYRQEEQLGMLFDALHRAPKQREAFTLFLELAEVEQAFEREDPTLVRDVPRKDLQAKGVLPSAIQALVERGALERYDHIARRGGVELEDVSPQPCAALNAAQETALAAIHTCWKDKEICLLHGVTSSGKTEVYIHLIEEQLQQGKQVLYLLPEIALTTQITSRLARVFQGQMGVYHSKFPDNERIDLWQRQLSAQPFGLILGVRSSIFLPWQNLGLVIIDEEHENSYKQTEPAPRYHARDTAMVLAQLHGAKTLLGTATPAIETYYHALQGKYGWVELRERFGSQELPEIVVEDMRELLRKRRMRLPLTPRLVQEMGAAFDHQEQVILFQNRRGYSPVLECHTCGWTPRCTACDVPLTVHKAQQRVVCHYCGATYLMPERCPQCEETNFRDKGYGTERIEDVVHRYFPQVQTRRMDLDTTRSRAAYDQLINDFAAGKTQVLIGTQMVTKGLDFERVHVVGIVNADQLLNAPDFRARERAFQMMSQVAGRAGRKGRRGLVVLQTRQADLPVVAQIVAHDYRAMYETEIEERRIFNYPPFCRLIEITLRHREDRICQDAAEKLLERLQTVFGALILGPERPVVARIKLLYLRRLLLKVPPSFGVNRVREVLWQAQQQLLERPELRGTSLVFDVDPQ